MTNNRRASVISLFVFFVLGMSITTSELSLVPKDQVLVFALLKFGMVFLALMEAIMILKNFHAELASMMFGITMMAYTIIGQLYRPLYYLSYFQCVFIFAILFPVSRFAFRMITGLGGLIITFIIYYRWDQFVAQSQSPVFSDFAFVMATVFFIAALTNTFFSSGRSFQEDATARFTQIGIHSARVIHDLKGLIGTPRLHIQYLQSRAGDSPTELETKKILKYIEEDLDNLKNTVTELNLLSSQDSAQKTWTSLASVYDSVLSLLSKQIHGTEIVLTGTIDILCDKALLTSVLVNLILNSVQNFAERKTANPKIEIIACSNSIMIRDNGGGFAPKVLRSFKRDQFFTTRKGGSGLGIMLSVQSIRTLKGKLVLTNLDDGALVELKLPKRLIRKVETEILA